MNGKQKGNSFEIQICRKLTKWVTGKERPEIFWRSASSGAKATASRKAGHETNMHGDIMACAPEGNFLTDRVFIECKHYKDLRFDPMLESRGQILGWWAKCCREATDASKYPLLIFKRNNGKTCVMIGDILCGIIKTWCNVCPTCYFDVVDLGDPNPAITIMVLENFLAWAVAEPMKLILKDGVGERR